MLNFNAKIRYDGEHFYATLKAKKKRSCSAKSSEPDHMYEELKLMLHNAVDNGIVGKTKGMFDYFADELEDKYDYSNNPDLQSLVKRVIFNYNGAIKARKDRFMNKAMLNSFNYFCSFTRDDSKIESFKEFEEKLKNTLKNLKAKNWTYMGVFEVSPKGRLHAHLLLSIPEGAMIGELKQITEWSDKAHRHVSRIENTYFRERFGKNDFKYLSKKDIRSGRVVQYILKYITKTSDKVFYARGLKDYIDSSINLDEDVVLIREYKFCRRYYLWDSCMYEYEDYLSLFEGYDYKHLYLENLSCNVVQTSFL